jgi:hypothetical protein
LEKLKNSLKNLGHNLMLNILKSLQLKRSLSCFIVFVLFIFSHSVYAATLKTSVKNPPKLKGITVSPALAQIKIQADESEHFIKFSITNNESSEQNIDLQVANFNTLNESGGLYFVGTKPTDLQKKYGLAQWAELPVSNVTIQPHKTINVKLVIQNQTSLAPGGHYGALMLSLNTDKDSGKSNKISVQPIASSLLFITKVGGEKYDLSLKEIKHNGDFWHQPDSVDLRFYNPGNVHVVPRGIIKLKSGKQTVMQGVINENSNLILPQTYRHFYVNLKHVAPVGHNLLNSYKLEVSYRYDGIDNFAIKTISVKWFNGKLLVICTVFIIFLMAGIVVVLKKLKPNIKLKRKKTS